MDHVAEAAHLQRHVNIHKRLAEIAEQHKKLDEEKTRLLEQLRPGASAQILVVSNRGAASSKATEDIDVTDGVQISKSKLKQVQKLQGNVEIDKNGHAVAISCHICHANVPKVRNERNPFFDLSRLRLHYVKRHKDDVEVIGMSDGAVLKICEKVRISQDDMDRIMKQEKPHSASLLPESGREARKRGATDDAISRRTGVDEEDDDEEIEWKPTVKRARSSTDGLASRRPRRSAVSDTSMYGIENKLVNSSEASDED